MCSECHHIIQPCRKCAYGMKNHDSFRTLKFCVVRSTLFDRGRRISATPVLVVLHAMQQAIELRSTVVTKYTIKQPSASGNILRKGSKKPIENVKPSANHGPSKRVDTSMVRYVDLSPRKFCKTTNQLQVAGVHCVPERRATGAVKPFGPNVFMR